MRHRGFRESIAHSRAASGGRVEMRANAPPQFPRLRARDREWVLTGHAKARCCQGHGKTRCRSRPAAASMRRRLRAVRSSRFPKASSSNSCQPARATGCVSGRVAPARFPPNGGHHAPRKPSAVPRHERRHSGLQATGWRLQARGKSPQTQNTCKKITFILAMKLRL